MQVGPTFLVAQSGEEFLVYEGVVSFGCVGGIHVVYGRPSIATAVGTVLRVRA